MGEWIRTIKRRVTDSVTKNPMAWFWFVALLIAINHAHDESMDLQAVCELSGSHDFEVKKPVTDRERLDNICIAHEPE